ncbi:hypothetical protein BV20DRAFT_678170 [Pilatotrama ljubarskyi]|nr:hypothetical protein BV20DRAFT_678170 [Pilatotrama ljubarskyi]
MPSVKCWIFPAAALLLLKLCTCVTIPPRPWYAHAAQLRSSQLSRVYSFPRACSVTKGVPLDNLASMTYRDPRARSCCLPLGQEQSSQLRSPSTAPRRPPSNTAIWYFNPGRSSQPVSRNGRSTRLSRNIRSARPPMLAQTPGVSDTGRAPVLTPVVSPPVGRMFLVAASVARSVNLLTGHMFGPTRTALRRKNRFRPYISPPVQLYLGGRRI